MMKLVAPIALVIGIVAWVFMALTAMNVLSGHLDTRTCQTDCVQTYFYTAAALGLVGTLTAVFAYLKTEAKILSIGAFLAAGSVCGLVAGLFVIGNFA